MSPDTYSLSYPLGALYGILIGFILTKIWSFRQISKGSFVSKFEWKSSYQWFLYVSLVYSICILLVFGRTLRVELSTMSCALLGSTMWGAYYTVIALYLNNRKSLRYIRVAFGAFITVFGLDIVYYTIAGQSFVLTAADQVPKTIILQYLGGINTLTPIGTVVYSAVAVTLFLFSGYFLFKIWPRRKEEYLIIIGMGLNIIFTLNDMISTADVLPLISLVGFGTIPEVMRLDRLLAHERSAHEEALKQELDLQTNIAIHSTKLAQLGELAATIGHEINNPLTILRFHADAMSRWGYEPDSPEFPEYLHLDKVDIAIDRIARISDGLRKSARKTDNVIQKFDLGEVIYETIDFVKDLFLKDLIQFEVRLPDDRITIKGNRSLIQQVFLNLFTNSRDAILQTKRDDGKIVVEASAADDIRILVQDNGSGVSEVDRPKIFEAFYTTKPHGNGTGIGLHFSAAAIHNHKGTIHLGETEEGTVFDIRLPAPS